MNYNKIIKLIFWIVLFESIGFLLGLLTKTNIHPWYEHLNKSSLTPPGFIFSIVWTLLYALLAFIPWILLNLNSVTSKKITLLFTLQMLMNWAWTPLFFGLHWLIPSALLLVILTCFNIFLIIEAKKTHEIIAWLLTPYLLWLVFASYLNIVTALSN